MGGSDAGDDEDDPAMAAVTAEKMESDEDSDRGSDHSGLKRKSLAMKMPVAKRPRKSSSDLDQGSPSLTEEENSETSSESEKNSDQDFTPEKKPVARAPRRMPAGGRKKKKVASGSDSDSKADSDSEMGNATVDMTKSDSNSDSDSDVSVKKPQRGRKPAEKPPPKPRGRKPKPERVPTSSSSDSDSDSDVDRISEWKRRDEERRRELEEKRKREQEEEIRRLREQEKEEKEKRKEKAEKGEEAHSDSDSSADDEVAKKGRKGRAKAPSSSDSDLEMEKEVKKPAKKQPSELSRKPNQKEKRGLGGGGRGLGAARGGYSTPEIMNWHFPLLFLLGTLTSVCSQFSFYPLEELSSDVGIQVFNQIVKAKPQDNVVVSPHGIASVLGVLQLGADGKTKKQLTTMMRYSVNGVGKALKKINRLIVSKKNKDIVTIANAVFAKSGFKMEVPFVTRNKEVFQCSVKSVDFEDPNAACDSINQWVKNETRGMIDQVVAPDDVDGLTRLVLVNAVYFKGLWKSRFRPENTKKRPFYGADGKTYQVPMLSQLSIFRCGTTSTPNELWYNIIELPYHGEMISMLIALPTESTTPLSAIIPHISTKTIGSWMTTMVAKRVQVILPKFTAVAETDLKDPLKALGITDMFDESKANFAKITRTEGLHVSHVLQKTKIEVSEDGTKASAATTAILIARSSPPWFIVDRPFVFFIRHNPTGTILFMGQINKP